MKISTSCQIERLASTDISRPQLTNVWYDVDKKVAVATNGCAMAIIGVTPDDGDHAGYVSPDALKAARKLSKKNGDAVILANGVQEIPGGPTFPRPSHDTWKFPPYEQVVPSFKAGDKGVFEVSFNPELLLDLVKALGGAAGGKRSPIVTLTIKAGDGYNPILVDVGASKGPRDIGILMPCRA
jgi:hypothetical protein